MDIMTEEQNRTLQDKFMLRLPDGMRDRIKAAAEANNRSMNAEIVAVLEEKYPQPTVLDEEMSEILAAFVNLPDAERASLLRAVEQHLREMGIPLMFSTDDGALVVTMNKASS